MLLNFNSITSTFVIYVIFYIVLHRVYNQNERTIMFFVHDVLLLYFKIITC